ncbi:MAG: hypothetical protein V1792_06765 [Pseudomonadota bacterium]
MKGSRRILPAVLFLVIGISIIGETPGIHMPGVSGGEALAEGTGATGTTLPQNPLKPQDSQFLWEMPGRVSIYNLAFGPALLKGNDWEFVGNSRTFNAGLYKDRLTLMIRFSYFGSRSEIPLKFVVKLPDSRQYDETVSLLSRRGQYVYHFTIHHPENFLGSGSVYLYYGFSMVDVLDFTIVPGS